MKKYGLSALYCSSTNLDGQCGTEMVDVERGDGVCVNVIDQFYCVFEIAQVSIRARNLAWLIELKVLQKSLQLRYMSFFVTLASSNVALIICICLVVFLCGVNPSWLQCNILCFSPQLVMRAVRILVQSLQMMLATSMGQQLLSSRGLSILWSSMVLQCFQ